MTQKIRNSQFNLRIFHSRTSTMVIILACMIFWVLIRLLIDFGSHDRFSTISSIVFIVLLGWRIHALFKRCDERHQELFLLPPALLWMTWMAFRGPDHILWWLPCYVLAIILASSQLISFVFYISIILISIALSLAHFSNYELFIGAACVTGLIVSIYKINKEKLLDKLRLNDVDMKLLLDASGTWYAKLNPGGEIVFLNELLLNTLEVKSDSSQQLITKFIDYRDVDLVLRTLKRTLTLEKGSILLDASCNCRLVLKNGSRLWVSAKFVRTTHASPEALVTFKDIDERLRLEEVLVSSQRNLASKTSELSAQFEITRNALHLRQEVERMAQHDLRSPLKNIEATATLLINEESFSSEQNQLLLSIKKTAARALFMVTMSLDLHRMEEGKFVFIPETIDLVKIARDAIAETSTYLNAKNIRVILKFPDISLKAIGNPLMTTSVIENLLRNAIEAAPKDSAITIGLYQGDRVGLLIHNEGEVDDSIKQNFFEKYVTHGKTQGLGLGTYSARLIARAQGGDLTMTSSIDNGTLLIFKLKKHINQSHKNQIQKTQTSFFEASVPGNLIEPPEVKPSHVNANSIDLLVVEDDDHNWLITLSHLPKNVTTRRASNGKESIEALITKRPDLILMDIEMPIMGGFTALSKIRELQKSAGEEPSIIYALTGYDDAETIQKVRNAGFDGFLSKPVCREQVKTLLAAIKTTNSSSTQNMLRIERSFVTAFPEFINSRRSLIDEIERSAKNNDLDAMRRAAHTLAGSPAIHGFHTGISFCRNIMSMKNTDDLKEIEKLTLKLRELFSNPSVL